MTRGTDGGNMVAHDAAARRTEREEKQTKKGGMPAGPLFRLYYFDSAFYHCSGTNGISPTLLAWPWETCTALVE